MPRWAGGGYDRDTDFCPDRARALRLEAGLTLVKLGEQTGIAYGQISKWELGKKRPCWANLQRLADGLGVPRSLLQHDDLDPTCSCLKESTK